VCKCVARLATFAWRLAGSLVGRDFEPARDHTVVVVVVVVVAAAVA